MTTKTKRARGRFVVCIASVGHRYISQGHVYPLEKETDTHYGLGRHGTYVKELFRELATPLPAVRKGMRVYVSRTDSTAHYVSGVCDGWVSIPWTSRVYHSSKVFPVALEEEDLAPYLPVVKAGDWVTFGAGHVRLYEVERLTPAGWVRLKGEPRAVKPALVRWSPAKPALSVGTKLHRLIDAPGTDATVVGHVLGYYDGRSHPGEVSMLVGGLENGNTTIPESHCFTTITTTT